MSAHVIEQEAFLNGSSIPPGTHAECTSQVLQWSSYVNEQFVRSECAAFQANTLQSCIHVQYYCVK